MVPCLVLTVAVRKPCRAISGSWRRSTWIKGKKLSVGAGGRNVVQYRIKKASYPKCPVTGQRLPGIKALRPQEYSNKRMSKRQKTVNRIYGGCLSHNVVRERIMRAFLVEEQKIVKKVWSSLSECLCESNLVPRINQKYHAQKLTQLV